MNPQLEQAAGSPIWQLAFVSFAIVLILFEAFRGWRRGIARQLARLGALMAAYFVAFFGGRLLVPMLRPMFKIPDIALSVVAGGVLALIVYTIINTLGAILFSRTRQHDSAVVRLVYGIGGAVLGVFFGAFLVWMVVVGVRSAGALADAQVRQQSAGSVPGEIGRLPAQTIHAVDMRRRLVAEPDDDSAPLMTLLARLKNSLEMGVIGDVVKRTDVVPPKAYETLGRLGQMASNPRTAERFLSFPEAHQLSENPKIVALRNDPEILQMITEGRLVDLLQSKKIIDAANDPELIEQIKKFDMRRALDYAVGQGPADRSSVEALKR